MVRSSNKNLTGNERFEGYCVDLGKIKVLKLENG
jgi:hypothetical protein